MHVLPLIALLSILLTPIQLTPVASPAVTWQPVSSPPGVALLSVAYAGTTAWVVGENSTVLRSTNGGQSFSPVDIGSGAGFYGVSFFDANHGIIVGTGGTVRRTLDGGASWSGGNSGTGSDLGSVSFAQGKTGWASGNDGVILRTDDCGQTWQRQSSGFGSDLNGIHFVDANYGWAAGNSGVILATSDGGRTWRQQKGAGSLEESLSSIYFADRQNGWASGDPYQLNGSYINNMWRTTNGGATWQRVTMPFAGQATNAVRFVDGQRGWAVAEERVVFQSTDGGRSWTVEMGVYRKPGINTWLHGLAARPDGSALAVGAGYYDDGSFNVQESVILRRPATQSAMSAVTGVMRPWLYLPGVNGPPPLAPTPRPTPTVQPTATPIPSLC